MSTAWQRRRAERRTTRTTDDAAPLPESVDPVDPPLTADGTTPMGGNLDMGGFDIVNVGDVEGPDGEDHTDAFIAGGVHGVTGDGDEAGLYIRATGTGTSAAWTTIGTADISPLTTDLDFGDFDAEKVGILHLKDGVTAPGTVSGYAQIYVDTADGDLKVRFGDGTVKTIVVDT